MPRIPSKVQGETKEGHREANEMTILIYIIATSFVLVLIAIILTAYVHCKSCDNWGSFSGDPDVKLLGDGREMEVREEFSYTDPRGKVWTAKQGDIVNGASIPRAFWPITGGPLTGRFRNASIVHDVYCVNQTEPWEEVHEMFYEACRCGGVAEFDAKVLFAAVYHFGPRWDEIREPVVEGAPIPSPGPISSPGPLPSPEVLNKIADKVRRDKLSLEEIKGIRVD